MKLRIEIAPELEEEVVLRAPEATAELLRLQALIGKALSGAAEIAVEAGGGERFLPCTEILFAETAADRTWIHTAKDCFPCSLRLYELEEALPRTFVRASKSCIVNTGKIESLFRSPTGVGEATFRGCKKKAFLSRAYFKPIREMIEETRLKK